MNGKEILVLVSIAVVVPTLFGTGGLANADKWSNTTYAKRVLRHNQLVLSTPLAKPHPLSLLVFAQNHQWPLNQAHWTDLLNEVGVNSTNSDFAIVALTRILSEWQVSTYWQLGPTHGQAIESLDSGFRVATQQGTIVPTGGVHADFS
jgi:hypothetical protein